MWSWLFSALRGTGKWGLGREEEMGILSGDTKYFFVGKNAWKNRHPVHVIRSYVRLQYFYCWCIAVDGVHMSLFYSINNLWQAK